MQEAPAKMWSLALLNHQPHPAGVRDAHAHAGVLHGAGQAHGSPFSRLVIIGLHRLQRFHKARGVVHDLAVGQLLPPGRMALR